MSLPDAVLKEWYDNWTIWVQVNCEFQDTLV